MFQRKVTIGQQIGGSMVFGFGSSIGMGLGNALMDLTVRGVNAVYTGVESGVKKFNEKKVNKAETADTEKKKKTASV